MYVCVVCDACDDGQEGGASGRDIINALVDNSSSFANKTAFAQQKYLKKKALQCVVVPVNTCICALLPHVCLFANAWFVLDCTRSVRVLYMSMAGMFA